MSLTFTPSNPVDMSKEKEWASSLGMMDWDTTKIVFTKRSLIEFLRTTGVTVDTNFSNISKIPKYATFGKLSGELESSSSTSAANIPASASASNASDDFKPTRRVRQAPGGKHTDIFGDDFVDANDALSNAPSKDGLDQPTSPPLPSTTPAATQAAEEEESGIQFSSKPIPSRRVRENPGGKDSIGSLWGDDASQDEFKPTRRVRQGPGGQDNVGTLF